MGNGSPTGSIGSRRTSEVTAEEEEGPLATGRQLETSTLESEASMGNADQEPQAADVFNGHVQAVVGKVAGTADATPLKFHVAITEEYLHLDDVVTCSRDIPGVGTVVTSGIVTDVVSRHEGAIFGSDAFLIAGSSMAVVLVENTSDHGGQTVTVSANFLDALETILASESQVDSFNIAGQTIASQVQAFDLGRAKVSSIEPTLLVEDEGTFDETDYDLGTVEGQKPQGAVRVLDGRLRDREPDRRAFGVACGSGCLP